MTGLGFENDFGTTGHIVEKTPAKEAGGQVFKVLQQFRLPAGK
jgi:signal recognition particle GTPase